MTDIQHENPTVQKKLNAGGSDITSRERSSSTVPTVSGNVEGTTVQPVTTRDEQNQDVALAEPAVQLSESDITSRERSSSTVPTVS
ncbi:hypothetical protein IC220_02805, partial [Wolbachia endosymbiont of Pentalonia nigronervosa]|uniref:hypothetical protein n=1 Tax=Wolbachia endosymbiont of Pentalonia nigronervosa TaxID=1301914 RepID=UPI00165F522C